MRRIRIRSLPLAVSLAAFVGLAPGLQSRQGDGSAPDSSLTASGSGKPNVVFILLDDMRASDLEHMPRVKSRLVRRGMTFPNFTVTLPTCCPSRATFLRGQYPHNHGIGHGEGAGEESFRARGLDRSTVGTWMQDAGYRTAYIGKYLNRYGVRRVPPGWSRWQANFDRDVWARVLNRNGKPQTIGTGNIDVHLGKQGRKFVTANGAKPFFLFQNFNAPHQDRDGPPPAPRADRRKFRGAKAPKPPGFNEMNRGMRKHFRRPPLRPAERRLINVEHRARLASLQVVDRQVEALIGDLRKSGKLDNTYIILTSDNGYHMGERRLGPGKMTPLLSDVRVPLVARGPGIEPGTERPHLLQNTDFAQTVAELGGASVPCFVDGRSFAPLLAGQSPRWRDASFFEGREPVAAPRPDLRFSGMTTVEGDHYIEYPDGFTEHYYLPDDPGQLRSLQVWGGDRASSTGSALAARLEAFRSCRAASCRRVEGH